MNCDFANDDGAYVLGVLSPTDRQAFQRHLPGCAECTRAVAELAGLPGLLGRVDAAVLETVPVEDEPVPTLLPALLREVRRTRRRRAMTTAGLAAAAAAVVVGVPLGLTQLGDDPAPPAPPGSGTSAAPVDALPMHPVGEVPVEATVSLEQVAWGTRLGLTCTYDRGWADADLPKQADYVLFVRTRSGELEQVGSWRSVSGRPMELTAGTATAKADLASVQVRTTDGRVVLRLAT